MISSERYVPLDEALRNLNIHDQVGPIVSAARIAISGSSGIARAMSRDYSPEVLEMVINGLTFLTEVVERDLGYFYEGVRADLLGVPEYDPRLVINLVNPPESFCLEEEGFTGCRARFLEEQREKTQPRLETLIEEIRSHGKADLDLKGLVTDYRSITQPYRSAQFKVAPRGFNPLHLA